MPHQHADVPVEAMSPPRFAASDPAMLEYLEEHGYAVVSSVLESAEDFARISSEFWDFHEALNHGVHRDDPSTWGDEFIASPATGIIARCGFGQSRFCWSLRTLPAVRKAFESIWRTEDLITSFDGGNAFRPDPEWRTEGGWWHCDQNGTKPDRKDRVCVQGLVLLTPANEYTGGFCVVPGSHKNHLAFSERHPWAIDSGDFLPVPEGDEILKPGGKLLRASPGDLILWDSRSIHCNGPAIAPADKAPPGAVPPSAELLRLAGYVCFVPASWCPEAVMERRARATLELVTSTHWPHAFVPTGRSEEGTLRRTAQDYSREETRLILGDHGLWPDALLDRKRPANPQQRAPSLALSPAARLAPVPANKPSVCTPAGSAPVGSRAWAAQQTKRTGAGERPAKGTSSGSAAPMAAPLLSVLGDSLSKCIAGGP
jgi:hypothetical protein